MPRIKYRVHCKTYAWVCSKCGMAIEADRQPGIMGCPAGGGHLWKRTIIY